MPATLDISLGPQLTEEQAEQIYKQGKEAVVFALLELAKKLAERDRSIRRVLRGVIAWSRCFCYHSVM